MQILKSFMGAGGLGRGGGGGMEGRGEDVMLDRGWRVGEGSKS